MQIEKHSQKLQLAKENSRIIETLGVVPVFLFLPFKLNIFHGIVMRDIFGCSKHFDIFIY